MPSDSPPISYLPGAFGPRRPARPLASAAAMRAIAAPYPAPLTTIQSDDMDRVLQAGLARVTHGISPVSLALAQADWALHLMASPGKWQRLLHLALGQQVRLAGYATRSGSGYFARPCIEPLPQDQRFRHQAWQSWPYSLIQQGFLLNQQWWHHATTGIPGVSPQHERVVTFMARQLLDFCSPVNNVLTSPEVLDATIRERGQNIVRGVTNLLNDLERKAQQLPPPGSERFEPGKQVALTRGKVILRNRLLELIQYSPLTDEVQAEPVLCVPAWLMKYYLLDLSRQNSLVSYMVRQGHTVFMISWRNPTADDRDLGLNDYFWDGLIEACKAVQTIVPGEKINGLGYGLGGSLLQMAAAWYGASGDSPFNALTLLATQSDYSDAGELTLFVDDSQVAYQENLMWRQGYLDTAHLAGPFQPLRPTDLGFSRVIHDYLLGLRKPVTDLMAWNADATRMPYRMHSEALRGLFLHNDLYAGRFRLSGRTLALSTIREPVFALAATTDHVAPWPSIYKLRLVAQTDLTFVLTSGGHHAGIVSEPGHPGRQFRASRWAAGAPYTEPQQWYRETEPIDGSWWPAWHAWACGQNRGALVEPPAMGAPGRGYPALQAAPGSYVHQR
jgi:polyhydroxyalkanoate synthase